MAVGVTALTVGVVSGGDRDRGDGERHRRPPEKRATIVFSRRRARECFGPHRIFLSYLERVPTGCGRETPNLAPREGSALNVPCDKDVNVGPSKVTMPESAMRPARRARDEKLQPHSNLRAVSVAAVEQRICSPPTVPRPLRTGPTGFQAWRSSPLVGRVGLRGSPSRLDPWSVHDCRRGPPARRRSARGSRSRVCQTNFLWNRLLDVVSGGGPAGFQAARFFASANHRSKGGAPRSAELAVPRVICASPGEVRAVHRAQADSPWRSRAGSTSPRANKLWPSPSPRSPGRRIALRDGLTARSYRGPPAAPGPGPTRRSPRSPAGIHQFSVPPSGDSAQARRGSVTTQPRRARFPKRPSGVPRSVRTRLSGWLVG